LRWIKLRSSSRRPKPRILEGYRVYAVGDVHGRADLLAALTAQIDDDLKRSPAAKPLQVFLGDYIDRGPDSRQVLDLLIERRRSHAMIFIKGNHEAYAVAALGGKPVLSEWMQIGGIPTLLSYGIKPSRPSDPMSERDTAVAFSRTLPESHNRFINGLAMSFTCGDFFFTHAGVRPGVPLRIQSERDLLWIRDEFLLHEEDFGKVVVHGHTPVMEPDIRQNRINIDTGAYATGRLTCMVLEGEEMRFL
jgi:serine/threonine protein phosphatase 1